MKDNFDLKKFLVENKTIENSNPYLKENTRTDAEEEGYEDGLKDGEEDEKSSLRSKIREMIINELDMVSPEYGDDEEFEMDRDETPTNYSDEIYNPEYTDDIPLPKPPSDEDDIFGSDFTITAEGEDLEEAKKDEEEVDVEEKEVTDEEGDEEEEVDVEAEETETETGGGLEDIAADMEGDESDLMDHLISALKVSKGMDNEKLTTQIGNTLKFFVGEYIGGEE